MKTNVKVVLVVVLAALSATNGYCGIKLTSGSLDFLKQEKLVNVEFVYDGMTVCSDKKTKKDPEPEQDFVARKVAEYNKKAAGRGDTGRENWVADRAAVHQPKFREVLNKYLSAKKMDLQFGSFQNAKYTLLFKTTYTEIGWKFSDIIKHPFVINAQAAFVETQNPAIVRAEITITASGSADTSDFSTRRGLVEAYGNAGKELSTPFKFSASSVCPTKVAFILHDIPYRPQLLSEMTQSKKQRGVIFAQFTELRHNRNQNSV